MIYGTGKRQLIGDCAVYAETLRDIYVKSRKTIHVSTKIRVINSISCEMNKPSGTIDIDDQHYLLSVSLKEKKNSQLQLMDNEDRFPRFILFVRQKLLAMNYRNVPPFRRATIPE